MIEEIEEKEYRIEEQDLRILKTILNDPLIGVEFAGAFDESVFVGSVRNFAKSALSYIKAYRSLPTKRVMLEHVGNDQDRIEEINAIYEALSSVTVSSQEYKYDLEKLKSRYAFQKIEALKGMLETPTVTDFQKYFRNLRAQIDEAERVQLGKKQAYTQRTLKDFIPEFRTHYNNKFHNKDLGRGILTQYSFLDYVKNGMSPGEMLIIGGETGAGKSMLLNNLAIQMWMQKNTVASTEFMKGYNVLYFSLEMPYEACFRRTMARVADVPMYGIRDASLNKFQLEAMNNSFKFIDKYSNHFEIVDIPRGVTVDQIEARFLEAKARYNPDVVVVDYLGLLEDTDADGEDWLKLGYIAGKLHEFSRFYNIVVLTAVQLNRPSNKVNKDSNDLIGIHRIGRSSLIMHHANIAIQIESRKDEATYGDLKYHVIKNRDGELGHHSLVKNFKHASLREPSVPFSPSVEEYGLPLETMHEDISALLEKYKWNQK